MSKTANAPAGDLIRELLDALKLAVRAMRDADHDEAMAGEFEILADAIDRAEGRA